MKSKLIALSLLLILLISPLSGIVYAQDDTGDGGVDDGTGDGTGDGTDDGTGDGSDDGTGDGTDDETGDDSDDEDGNIDPVIYEQIRQQSRERFQELYTLMFGEVAPEPVDDGSGDGTDDGSGDGTDDGTGDDGTGDDGTGDDGTGDGTDDGTGDGTDDGTEGDDELPPYDGPVIPDDVDPALRNQFMSAWSAMEGAEEKENPRAAANQYLRAMKQLRNAYRKYQQDNPEVVEDLTAPEGEEGVPEGEAPEEPTPEELDEVKKELVGRFQERFQERVTQMLENYNDVENTLSPGDAVKAFDALTKAEAKLLRIQERIAAGEVDGALDDLDDASDELGDDLDDLDDDASSQMFRTMNKLEARIGKMVEQAERKASKGQDTSDLDAAVAAARGNKDKTKTDFKEDKGNGNSGNDKDTGKPEDKDTGKPDDKGKPDNSNKGGKKDK